MTHESARVRCVCRPCRNVDAVHVLALRAWANLKKALERTTITHDIDTNVSLG